jgi:RHS repeat-associated protein
MQRNYRYHNIFTKFISLLLVFSLLTISTPAAPSTITAGINSSYQNVRFGFLSSWMAIEFPNWIAGFFSTTPVTSENTPINRIQILPGDISIRQGEQVVFTAIAYDAQDAPVSGVDFEWSAADTGRGFESFSIQDGRFEPWVFGTFTVTAVGGGLQTQTIVTVIQATTGNFSEIDSKNKSTSRTISTRSNKKEITKETVDSESKKDGQTPSPSTQNLLPGEGVWNNGNWNSADDPGNLPGNPPGSPADDGAGSGNFQLSAPVISLPGRGIDLALNLNYNSHLWNKSGSELTYDIDRGFPAPGWSLGFGKIMDMGNNGGSMLVDADGTHHSYTGELSGGSNNNFTDFVGHTTNGKFIDYASTRDPAASITGAWAYFANGTYILYGAKGDGAVYPTYLRDAQGNYITVTYRNNQGPAIETITDTLGRVINFNYDSSTPARLISVTAPRMQNEDPIYGEGKKLTLLRLHYKPLTLNYSFASGVTAMVRDSAPNVIDSIYYPATNTGYWFNDTDSYSSYGMLTKVVEQRGMNWSAGTEPQGTVTAGSMSKKAVYNYPLTTTNQAGRTNGIGLSDAPTYTTLTESWDGRDVNEDAVTTYLFNNTDYHWDGTSNSPARTTTVTQPNGAISKQYSYRTPNAWTDGLVFADETIIMNGSTPTTVSSSLVSWQQGEYESPRPNWGEITDENGKKVKTVYTYGNAKYNQITRSCDYDNSNTLLRCAIAQYENSSQYTGQINYKFWFGPHIFSLPTASGVENPDGTKASWTNIEYDNYQNQSFVNTPDVVHHEAAFDPFTTQTVQQQGPCVEWYQPPQGAQVCVRYQINTVSAYNSGTDKRGNITKATNYSDASNSAGPSGAIDETKGYDITGNLVKASTACCEQTTIEYGGQSETQYAYPKSQTRGSFNPNSPDRITTSAIYNETTGLMKQQTDANGRISTMMYNPDTLRPVKSISSTGAYSTFAYDDTAMTVTEEVHESNNNLAGKTIKYLNGVGLTKREESLGTNNVWDIVEVKYTKYAEEWKQSRPYRTGDTVQWTERFYDSQGRLSKVVEPDGSETKAFYNETNRPDSASTAIGNTMRLMDAWGRERWGRYDQQGRLAEVVEPNPDRTANPNGSIFAAGSLMTKYTQDTLGRLTKTEQGSQTREFKYDNLGRLTRQKLAEQTATLNDSGTYVGANGAGAKWSEMFMYDSRSNLTVKTDARGVKTYFSYSISGADDPLNRLQTVSYDTSGPLDPNLTIHAASTVAYSYMTTGDKTRLSQIRTDGLLTENFSYDVEGRVSDYTQTVDARTSYPMTVSYLYDTLDRVKDVRYPAAYGLANNPRKLIQNSYDVASRLSSMKVDNTEVAGNIAYNAADQTTSIKIGAAGANQVTESYTFDQQTGLLTNQKVQKSGQNLLNLSYDYNRNNAVGSLYGKTGHLTKIINNLDANKNREYEFDALGRLTKAKGGNNLWTQNYTYDRYGNRTNVTALGVAADNSPIPLDGLPGLTYNLQTNRITTTGYEYDSAGNQTKAKAEDGSWIRMEYDAANRLRVVKKDSDGTTLQAFQYGSTNVRLMDLDYGYGYLKIFCSMDGTTLSEYTEFTGAVPTWTKSYTYLGGSQLSTVTPNGAGGETVEYNHPDLLGTRITTNQQNGTSTEQSSLPFGTALSAETSRSESKRFTSYERSARTGLDYAVNRTYDSKQGRFTQVDPIKMQAVNLFNPQTLNFYSYCGNDPINHTDPSGLFWGSLFKWLSKGFKWIALAVTVALIVVSVVAAHGTLSPFLAKLLGILAKINNFIGAAAISAETGAISVGIGTYISAGLYGVGAVENQLADKKRKRGKAVPLKGEFLTVWRTSRDALLKLLENTESDCYKFLKSKGIDPSIIAKDLKTQTPYDLNKSTNKLKTTVFKTPKQFSDYVLAQDGARPDGALTDGYGGNIYYGGKNALNVSTILHENIHRNINGILDDDALGVKLGTIKEGEKIFDKPEGSKAIGKTLEDAGCK